MSIKLTREDGRRQEASVREGGVQMVMIAKPGPIHMAEVVVQTSRITSGVLAAIADEDLKSHWDRPRLYSTEAPRIEWYESA